MQSKHPTEGASCATGPLLRVLPPLSAGGKPLLPEAYDGVALVTEICDLAEARLPLLEDDDPISAVMVKFLAAASTSINRPDWRGLRSLPTDPQQAWEAAWSFIAAGCKTALASLPAEHPRRSELAELTADAVMAAGQVVEDDVTDLAA